VCTKDCDGSSLYGDDIAFDFLKNDDHLILSKNFIDGMVSIEFLIVASCCQEFGCDYNINQNELSINYFNISNTSCPCICKYWYRLDINNQVKEFDSVIINGKLAIDSTELANEVKTGYDH
jgi:hypothetical protein